MQMKELLLFYLYYSLLFLRKPHTFWVILKSNLSDQNPTDFHENFDTFESDENWSLKVIGHCEHEAGLSFLITRFLKAISLLFHQKEEEEEIWKEKINEQGESHEIGYEEKEEKEKKKRR